MRSRSLQVLQTICKTLDLQLVPEDHLVATVGRLMTRRSVVGFAELTGIAVAALVAGNLGIVRSVRNQVLPCGTRACAQSHFTFVSVHDNLLQRTSKSHFFLEVPARLSDVDTGALVRDFVESLKHY